ncbi:MAG: phosphoenolpyruvate carboxylase [Lactobacillaceae bacterium]|jgi:phosphoenolpyruvate carboxylase|nr:phosphoenolpyruvate carboxylase [Lactobacillaceae bacterium]
MERKIPVTMGTQHPDNANAAFWDNTNSPFISAYSETYEAFQNFSVLNVDEYMWDWEGKHADAAVIDRLFSSEYDYFKEHALGSDEFITFRFPNIWEETGYNLMQAMTAFLSAEDFGHDLGFKQRPLFEAILPMAERADQIIEMQRLFERLSSFKTNVFTEDRKNSTYIKMIPLFEGFDTQLHAPDILKDYLALHEKHFGVRPEYMRVFLAGSDSALSSGFMSSIIGNKLAIAGLYVFSDAEKMPIFPIVGMGSAIFRGGLSPRRIERFAQEFSGVRTVTVQSAFRYDFPLEEVRDAIAKLNDVLPEAEPITFTSEAKETLVTIAEKSAEIYRTTLDELVMDMQPVFKAFPKRRDRRQHVGVLGYSREVDGIALPRAITFTGAFYSIGVPPEFIGFGRSLKSLTHAELATLVQSYPNMERDFTELAQFISLNALAKLEAQNAAWGKVREDIEILAEIFNLTIGPQTKEERQHAELADQLVDDLEGAPVALTAMIERQAQLRHFLG